MRPAACAPNIGSRPPATRACTRAVMNMVLPERDSPVTPSRSRGDQRFAAASTRERAAETALSMRPAEAVIFLLDSAIFVAAKALWRHEAIEPRRSRLECGPILRVDIQHRERAGRKLLAHAGKSVAVAMSGQPKREFLKSGIVPDHQQHFDARWDTAYET